MQNKEKLKTDTFLSFIDFQKAFDFVPHDLLYHKLVNLGVDGDLYHSIRSIYRNPISCVQLNGQLTDWFPITSRVRQGNSLSPTLFAAYINDLADEIESIQA